MAKANAPASPPPVEPRGPARRHKAEEQQAAQAQAQVSASKQQHAEFNSSFGACMKGKGYTVG
jgi:hypothetical protein